MKNPAKPLTVFIYAEAGFLRDSLCAILVNSARVKIVGTTFDRQDSLEIIHQFQPDIALVDCSNHHESLQVIRAIRQLYADIKIIAITDGIKNTASIELAGADVELMRGFRGQELEAALNKARLRKNSGDEPAGSTTAVPLQAVLE